MILQITLSIFFRHCWMILPSFEQNLLSYITTDNRRSGKDCHSLHAFKASKSLSKHITTHRNCFIVLLRTMGVVEELEDTDAGECPVCTKVAENKCTACKAVFYCNRDCQKKHWKTHKFDCKSLPYKVNFKLTAQNCSRD